MVYNKLVRDFIPYQLVSKGKAVLWKDAKQEEILPYLVMKLREESTELINAKSNDEIIEEMADLREVLDTIAKQFGIREDQIIACQNKKRAEKGGFTKFFILQKVD